MTNTDGWYWLNTSYACGGLRVLNGLIVEACPIYQWMQERELQGILTYLRIRKQLMECQPLAKLRSREGE